MLNFFVTSGLKAAAIIFDDSRIVYLKNYVHFMFLIEFSYLSSDIYSKSTVWRLKNKPKNSILLDFQISNFKKFISMVGLTSTFITMLVDIVDVKEMSALNFI